MTGRYSAQGGLDRRNRRGNLEDNVSIFCFCQGRDDEDEDEGKAGCVGKRICCSLAVGQRAPRVCYDISSAAVTAKLASFHLRSPPGGAPRAPSSLACPPQCPAPSFPQEKARACWLAASQSASHPTAEQQRRAPLAVAAPAKPRLAVSSPNGLGGLSARLSSK